MRELLSKEQITHRVKEMGQEISAHYNDEQFTCLVILKGSFIFAADLFREISCQNMDVDFIRLSSYSGTKSTGKVEMFEGDIEKYYGKNLLVIEDIVDTGLTLNWFLEHIHRIHPKSVRIASFLEKSEINRGRVKIDFLGHAIEDKFVVGYGLDFDEKYRNLPNIVVLNED